MRKVFFSEQNNAFGHNYRMAMRTPCEKTSDPVEAMSRLLEKNPTTRKAVLTFIPYGDEKIPCINSIQFMIRNNMLDIVYNARGQDIYRKFPCDAMCMAEYAVDVAKMIGIRLGNAAGNISSAHIYMKDLETVKSISILIIVSFYVR